MYINGQLQQTSKHITFTKQKAPQTLRQTIIGSWSPRAEFNNYLKHSL